MAWIESHTNLHRHPKIIKTQRVFGWDNDQAVGKMMKFWHWCLEFADSGVLDAYDAEDIAAVFGVTLDPSALVQRMVAIGWLDDDPVLRVHDWLDYAGKYLHAKYHTSNPEKLKDIYAAHDRIYGKNNEKTKVERRPHDSPKKVQRKPLLPNLTSYSSSSLRSEEESPPPPFAGGAVTVEQVVQTWNAIPGVRQCAEKPAGFIADRIRKQIVQHPDWDWWASYWHLIAESDFLCGRSNDFAASIDWVLGPKNMAKVQNGNYRNKSPVARLNTTCQTRVQCGLQLKPCGQPAIGLLGKRPVCQAHQEEHVKRTDNAAMRSGNGTSGSGSVTLGSLVRLDKRCVAG